MDKRETEKALEQLLGQFEREHNVLVTGVQLLTLTSYGGAVPTRRRLMLETTPAPGAGWEG